MTRQVLERPARSAASTPVVTPAQHPHGGTVVDVASMPKSSPAQIRAALAKRHQATKPQAELSFAEVGLVDELRQLVSLNIRKKTAVHGKTHVSSQPSGKTGKMASDARQHSAARRRTASGKTK